MSPARHVMITARVSPMVELARWLFERQRLPYEEQAHVPMVHALATLRVGGGLEVPVILGPGGSKWKGARDTLDGLDRLGAPGARLYGEDAGERASNQAVIEKLLGHLLQTVRRHVYYQLLPFKEVLFPVVTEGAPGWEKAFVRYLYPVWRWMMGRGLKFTPALLAEAPIEIGRAMALVEEELARRGTPFLAGARPGPADIVAAALLAPVVLPPNYGSRLPGIEQLPPGLRAFTDAARGRPAGDLVLRTYREARATVFQGSLEEIRAAVHTPVGQGGLLARIAAGRGVPAFAARLGARLARIRGGPFRLRNTVIAARHADVLEVLARDLDFRVAPINAARMEAVNGAFVLGMDRGPVLERERRALYAALAAVDLDAIIDAAAGDADALLDAAGDEIDAVGGYARLVAGRTATRLFGAAGPDEALFLDAVRAIFAHTFLNIGNDGAIERRALVAGQLMRDWFTAEIARRRLASDPGIDMMGMLLRQGHLDDDAVRRTLGGMLVGSIDTTASTVAKALVVMAEDARLFEGAARRSDETRAAWYRRLDGWQREALRWWPHNPIVLRQAVNATRLGKCVVPASARIVVWTQAAMQDASAFPDSDRIFPRPDDAYLHMGAGLHPCAGRAVNARQIPMLLGKLIERRFQLAGPMQWAGRFPHRLPVRIEGHPA